MPSFTLFFLFFIFLIIFLIISIIRSAIKASKRRKRDAKEKERLGYLVRGRFLHFSGLPLAENAVCFLYYYDDRLSIEGAGQVFNLLLDKVTDITVTTDVEIQKSYVSSIGGAVGGALLFGPVGAMIGGRARERSSKKITSYLVVTYKKEGEITYIAFQMGNVDLNAGKIIKLFRQRPKAQSDIVEL